MATELGRADYAARRTEEVVLDAIARILPFVPRDITVKVEVVPASGLPDLFNTSIKVTPITDMGKAIYPVLKKYLHEELSKSMKPIGATSVEGDKHGKKK